MTATADAATEHDVALDLVALIDSEPGDAFGSEDTTILSVTYADERGALVITLDNGQTFNVRVREGLRAGEVI